MPKISATLHWLSLVPNLPCCHIYASDTCLFEQISVTLSLPGGLGPKLSATVIEFASEALKILICLVQPSVSLYPIDSVHLPTRYSVPELSYFQVRCFWFFPK